MNGTANTNSEPAQEPLRDLLVAILEAIELTYPATTGGTFTTGSCTTGS